MKTPMMPLVVLVTTGLMPGSGRADPTPTRPCATPEYRQFDFWVGNWDVYPTARNQLIAHSLIENVYNGCGVRENWMPLKTENTRGSLNIYVPSEKAWRQTWIDSSGARVDFKGGWNGTVMILKGFWADFVSPGVGAIVRMTYSKAVDGSVRQVGQSSQDGGNTWAASFDLTYRPAKR